MIDTKNVFLSVRNYETGETGVERLDRWILRDTDAWLIPRKRQKSTLLILGAFSSQEEAQTFLDEGDTAHG